MRAVEIFEYKEPNSTFTHAGRDYDLDILLQMSEDLPLIDFAVDELVWIFEFDDPRPARVKAANLSAPILVAENEGRLVVLDGLHRLAKAYLLSRKHIVGRLVPDDMLTKCECALRGDVMADIRSRLATLQLEFAALLKS